MEGQVLEYNRREGSGTISLTDTNSGITITGSYTEEDSNRVVERSGVLVLEGTATVEFDIGDGNMAIYRGDFLDNLPHGKGTISVNGRVLFQGLLDMGTCLEGKNVTDLIYECIQKYVDLVHEETQIYEEARRYVEEPEESEEPYFVDESQKKQKSETDHRNEQSLSFSPSSSSPSMPSSSFSFSSFSSFSSLFLSFFQSLSNEYIGERKRGSRHGLGMMKYKSGDMYLGEWMNGNKHGWGLQVHTNGTVYIGQWRNDLRHGHGLRIEPNGFRYEGNFTEGMRDGGVLATANGSIIDNNYRDKELGRKGASTTGSVLSTSSLSMQPSSSHASSPPPTFPSLFLPFFSSLSNEYLGGRKRGSRHGLGMMKYSSGDVYVGEWMNNTRHGWGIEVWVNGNVYIGEWQNDLKHGHGSQMQANGRRYEGNYTEGREDGGVLARADGSIIDNNYRNKKLNQKGTSTTGGVFNPLSSSEQVSPSSLSSSVSSPFSWLSSSSSARPSPSPSPSLSLSHHSPSLSPSSYPPLPTSTAPSPSSNMPLFQQFPHPLSQSVSLSSASVASSSNMQLPPPPPFPPPPPPLAVRALYDKYDGVDSDLNVSLSVGQNNQSAGVGGIERGGKK
ncbi:hypothetical protein FACS1894152_3160 [Bacilli bacterium]|nr:hypothetical protein FACS1894152_3160 [Bacilli bacterium]